MDKIIPRTTFKIMKKILSLDVSQHQMHLKSMLNL